MKMAQNKKCSTCNNQLGKNVKSTQCKQCRDNVVASGRSRKRGTNSARSKGKVSKDTDNQGTDINLCGICCEEVTDDDTAMNCEACNKWFHTECIGMESKLYDLIRLRCKHEVVL